MANSTRRRAQIQAQRLAAAKKARRRRNIVLAVVLGLILIALLIYLLVLRQGGGGSEGEATTTPTASAASGGSASGEPTAEATETSGAEATTAPTAETVTPPNATADGKGLIANPAATDAAHTLVVYGDYQCSGCYSQEEFLKPILQEIADSTTVRLEFRNRDFLDEAGGHGSFSRIASIGSACADTVGFFFPYHLAVFDHYGELSDTVLGSTIPAELGIEGDALAEFQQCYYGQATRDFVDGMESQADEDMYNAGYDSTPTFVLDGEQITPSSDWTDDSGALDLEKARAALGLGNEP
jgi:protein-disulfide isomerase